ncbi:Hypothetical protein HDN1F_10650 [gamma proteobacterium HdN1]|nr:Hypothetical protein HDN1F_10650 [gamma proteobacterium HdN1]
MSEIADRLKEQLEQGKSALEKVASASKGLYIKAKEEGNKQFNDLVAAGQTQDAEAFLEQLKKDVVSPFEDLKNSLEQIRNASFGLLVKARNNGDKAFNELVELGQSQKAKETA